MNENLYELGEIYKEKFSSLKEYELIEKITPSKNELEEIAQQLKSFLSMSNAFSVLQGKKEIVSIFLVGCAKYYYNDGEGGFWSAVNKLIGVDTINQRAKLIDIFEKTLRDYKLNTFDELKSEGYKKLAPVIAHSGLPVNLYKNLLDGLSCVLFQNISYNDLGEETLFCCSKYVAPNVQRYLKVLNSNGLLNDYVNDIIEFIRRKLAVPDKSLNIPITLQEELLKWMQNKDVWRFVKQRGFARPKLKYDINSRNIILETPLMLLDNYSQLAWEIETGQGTIIKKRIYAEEVNGTNRFRSTFFIIDSIDILRIKLLDNLNNCIYSMTIKESEDYLTFNNYGQLNKTKFILNNGAFILISNQYEAKDINFLRSVGNCNLYYQQPTDLKETVCFENNAGKHIDIKIKRPFELSCDRRVIGDNCSFDGINAYYEIPQIMVPFNGMWKVAMNIENNMAVKDICVDNYLINLSGVFENINYGKICLRLFNETIGYKTFKFLYLPNIKAQYQYFPAFNGYNTSTPIKFANCENYYICNENHIRCDKLDVYKDRDYIKLFYYFYGQEFGFNLVIKPFSWKIETDGELIGQINRRSCLSTKDIKRYSNIILFVQNNYNEDIYIHIDGNKKGLNKMLLVRKNTERLVNLKEYYELFVASLVEADIFIEVNDNKICEICQIKPNLTIANFTITQIDGIYILTWDEDGACVNRKLKIRDLYKPFDWTTIPINDKDKMIFIDPLKLDLKSNYIVEIIHEEKISGMFFANYVVKEKIIEPTNSKVLYISKEQNFENNFHLETFDTIEKLIESYMIYKFYEDAITDVHIRIDIISKLLFKIKEQRFQIGDEKVIQCLYHFDLSKEQFNEIAKDMSLFFPIFRYDTKFTSQQYDYLKGTNPCLYFISALVKRDFDQCIKIIDSGKMTMINSLKDVGNYRWAKKYLLFPEIDEIEELRDEYDILKNQFPYTATQEEVYLSVIVEKMLNGEINESADDVYVLTKLSDYVNNLFNQYPNKFISELFKSSSNQKKKGEIKCR